MQSFQPRPFNAWARAQHDQERGPSLWRRTRDRIARLFGKNALNHRDSSRSDAPDEDDAISPEVVTPPDGFSFPWTRSGAPAEATATLEDALPTDEDAAGAVQKGPFSRADLPLLEPFRSVDDALPTLDGSRASARPRDPNLELVGEADTDPMLDPVLDAGDSTQEVPRPPGLFARLFGLKKAAELAEPAIGERPSDEINPAFLAAKFRTFYNEIVNQKHQGSEFASGFATAILSQDTQDESGMTPAQAAETLSLRLQQMLELQQAEATWTGGETATRYPDAQYAMAVLADETLSTMEWKGKSAWPEHSLEQRLYKSNAAGLELFRRVDRLFKDGTSTAVSRDLARVYLLTIAAGFRGKYGAFGLTRALHEYRQRLYEYIHGGDALLLYDDDRRIFPQALSRTIVGKAMSRFSGAQRWVAVLVVVLIAYTVLAHVAWNRASADLRDVTSRVEFTQRGR
jgi:type VI secretion system protein ImpK